MCGKKYEKVLEIRLIDAPVTEAEKKTQSAMTPTLGDLTIIRKTEEIIFFRSQIFMFS